MTDRTNSAAAAEELLKRRSTRRSFAEWAKHKGFEPAAHHKTKLDRVARSTADLYRIVSQLTERGIAFKVLDDPSIDTTSRTGKLVMGILALIAEFENDIRRERQQDGINKALERGVRFGRKPLLTEKVVATVKGLRADGATIPEIMRRTRLSEASVYRALA
jgi:DNA invertase Pin-like site-specific DNA recombinase